MGALIQDKPRYYGSLLNLEHRVMSGAVVALAVIVLVLFSGEGSGASDRPEIRIDTPAGSAYGGELDEWVRPAEITVQAPSARPFVGDLDEWLLTPVRFVKARQPAFAASEAAGKDRRAGHGATPARPLAVKVDPPVVEPIALGESLAPAPLRRLDGR